MRVLHLTGYYWPATEWGGPARSVPLLARATHRAGAQVEVITTNVRGSDAQKPVATGTRSMDGVPVTYCRGMGPRRFFFSPGLGAEVARRLRRVDLIHVQSVWTFPPLVALLASSTKHIPFVLSARGTLDRWSLAQRATKKKIYMHLVAKRILRRAAALHLTAAQERQAMPRRWQGLPAVVVPNPVDLETFLELSPSPPPSTKLRLIMAGRIHEKKGFDLLLPALSRITAGGLDVTLTIAGPDEGGYADEVRRLAQDVGVAERLHFTGNLEPHALARTLEAADLLVMPSYQENFGMSAAEALAAARPVLLSDGVNIAEEVANAGAGVVVPREIEAIADALTELAGAPERRRDMGRRGRELAQARWGLEAIGQQMVAFYRKILKDAAPHRQHLETRT